jgi:cytochrome c556
MIRLFALMGVLALAAVLSANVYAEDKDDKKEEKKEEKIPTTSQIMAKFFGKGQLKKKLDKAVADEKWEEAAKLSAEFKKLAEANTKNKPKRGTEESWKDLTGSFLKNATAADEAVGKKEGDKAKEALAAIGGSCKACHDAHRGKGK